MYWRKEHVWFGLFILLSPLLIIRSSRSPPKLDPAVSYLVTNTPMAPKFDLATPKGLGGFNGYISSRSYVEGYNFSQVGGWPIEQCCI